MMRIITRTPTRKSRTVKTNTIAARHTSAALIAWNATKIPHAIPSSTKAATMPHFIGVIEPEVMAKEAGVADMALGARRAGDARRVGGRDRGEERSDERSLRREGGIRIRGEARDPHEHSVGNAPAQTPGELQAEALGAF